MPEIVIVAEVRAERGSRPARRLRHAGRIPAVVYGHGDEPVPISVDARELRVALSSEAGANALFDLDVDGDHHLAIARELQRHPVRHTVAHVDFQIVRRDEVVPADVPVHLVGEATATTRAGGTVEHLITSIHVRARPADIPVAFEVDISELEIGDSVRIGEITAADGVSIEGDPETIIVIAHPPRAIVEEEVGEEAEGEAGEAGEGAPAGADAPSDEN